MIIPVQHLITAFISPACHAWANTIDNLLSDKYHKNITFLLSVSKILQFLLIIPFLFFFHSDLGMPQEFFIFVAGIVACNIFYNYPYYWALTHTDTSVVVALFALGKITIPIFAWIFLHEQLSLTQYAGFFLIIAASLMLTFNWRKFHLNRAALYMLVASLLLSFETIFEKYILIHNVAWTAVVTWSMAIEALIGIILLLYTSKKSLHLWQRGGTKQQSLFALEAFLSMAGNAGGLLALSLIPISIAKALSGTQHLFVACYAKIFHPIWPNYFKEDSSNLHPALKLSGLLLTVLGTILAVGYF